MAREVGKGRLEHEQGRDAGFRRSTDKIAPERRKQEKGHEGTGWDLALLRRGTDRKGGWAHRAYGRDRAYREEVALEYEQ